MNDIVERIEDAENATHALFNHIFQDAREEIERLRAKIAEMEQQEPVGTLHDDGYFVWRKTAPYESNFGGWKMALYALPGAQAQPAPSEHDESVRKSWARFSHELHRSPDAPNPGMSEAFEQHFSQSFTDREWRAEASTWAAAWKAAKRHGAQPAPSVPDGWKLVPIEPTTEIRKAMHYAYWQSPQLPYHDGSPELWNAAYAAMLEAAPEAKP